MNPRQPQPIRDEAPDAGPRELRDLGGLQRDGGDYAAVLHEFGEVMNRVGRLEASVEGITETLEEIRAHGRLAAGSASAQSPQVDALPDQSTEIEQMRLQLTNLATQLANADAELAKLTGRDSRRHRRSRLPTPFWTKVLHRLGIG